jgi:hypothetical protein
VQHLADEETLPSVFACPVREAVLFQDDNQKKSHHLDVECTLKRGGEAGHTKEAMIFTFSSICISNKARSRISSLYKMFLDAPLYLARGKRDHAPPQDATQLQHAAVRLKAPRFACR